MLVSISIRDGTALPIASSQWRVKFKLLESIESRCSRAFWRFDKHSCVI